MIEFFKSVLQFFVDLFKAIEAGPTSPQKKNKLHDLVAKNSPGIGPKMLRMASDWFNHELVKNRDYMVLIDFDRETSPRLWLVNRKTGRSEIFKVAHASNSDPDKDGKPTEFSNVPGSKKSSLGAMVTAQQYGKSVGGWSKFNRALKLKGLQQGLNDNVFDRAIVFHSSSYVNDVKGQLIGDSWGCPAVSEKTAARIISLIDNGALFFIYHRSLDALYKQTKSYPLFKSLALIKEFEGLRLNAYLDPVGIPTIGYGTIRYPDGSKVRMGDRITEAQAEDYLLDHVESSVVAKIDPLIQVPLTENQYNALVSFVYNVGIGAFQRSTMLRKLNSGDYIGAAFEFPRWKLAGGKILAGLVRRRKAERALFEA